MRYVHFTRITLSPIVNPIAQKTVQQKSGEIIRIGKIHLLVFSIVMLGWCYTVSCVCRQRLFSFIIIIFGHDYHVRSRNNGGFRLTFALGIDAMVRARQVLDQVVRQVAFAERHVVDFHRPGGQLQQRRRIVRHVAYEPHHQRVVTQAQLESQMADS